jgi:hypothetical protein
MSTDVDMELRKIPAQNNRFYLLRNIEAEKAFTLDPAFTPAAAARVALPSAARTTPLILDFPYEDPSRSEHSASRGSRRRTKLLIPSSLAIRQQSPRRQCLSYLIPTMAATVSSFDPSRAYKPWKVNGKYVRASDLNPIQPLIRLLNQAAR